MKYRYIKSVLFLGISALLLGQAAGYAEPGAIYVVDMQRVINESIAGQAARKNLESDSKKRTAALEGPRRDFMKLQEELKKQEGLLSPAALQEKRELLEVKGRDLSRRVQDQQEELKQTADREMAGIVTEIRKVIAELGESGSYGFIMEKDPRLVVYASDKLDLTSVVVERLNKMKVNL